MNLPQYTLASDRIISHSSNVFFILSILIECDGFGGKAKNRTQRTKFVVKVYSNSMNCFCT